MHAHATQKGRVSGGSCAALYAHTRGGAGSAGRRPACPPDINSTQCYNKHPQPHDDSAGTSPPGAQGTGGRAGLRCAKNSPIFAWRDDHVLRTTASVATSTRSLNGLGFSGDAASAKGLAGDGGIGLRSQPANGTRGGGTSAAPRAAAPKPYPSPTGGALNDLSTAGFTCVGRLTLHSSRRKQCAGSVVSAAQIDGQAGRGTDRDVDMQI
jgi:hypothetical protein